ncbi:MAG: peptidyl-prolyl cis-trans isomerase [Caulobacterales bacterium]
MFRAFAKSWFATGLIAVLILAFVVFGVRDVFRGRIADAVVQAGSRTVTTRQFEKLFDRQKEGYETKSGQAFPLDEALKEHFDQQFLQHVASDTAYAAMLDRSGVSPSDDLVAAELAKTAASGKAPALAAMFDSVTGKFKKDALDRFLGENGLTRAEFDAQMRNDIANDHFMGAIETGFRPPRLYSALEAALALESRDASFFVIPASSVPRPAPPTDAQLAALIKQHADQLTRPERRVLSLIRFSAKDLAPSMTVDPADVQKEFDFKKETYAKPELRTLVQIPIKDPATAATVQARLQGGEDPAAVARSVGVDAITYTDQPQSAIADRKVGAAAFALPAGQVSGLIQGDIRAAVVKVVKVTPGQAANLESVRGQIEAELRLKAATDKVYDLSQKYEDARQGGATMAQAAQKLGLTVVSVGPVAANGADATGQPNPLLTEKLLKSAFGAAQGADSDVEQAEAGEYFTVHVDQVLPPSLPTVDEVRGPLTQFYLQQALGDALKAKADAATAALKAGKTMAEVAATYHAQVAHQVGVQQINAEQYKQTLGQEFMAQLFAGNAGAIFLAGAPGGAAVVRIDAIRPSDPATVARLVDGARDRVAEAYVGDLLLQVHAAAGKLVKVRTNLDLARQAMGITPDMVAKAGSKGPAAK